MRWVACALLVLVCTQQVLGCAEEDLYGTWDGSMVSDDFSTVSLTATFNSDSSFNAAASYTCEYDATTQCNLSYYGSYVYQASGLLQYTFYCADDDDLPACCSCPQGSDVGPILWSTDCSQMQIILLGMPTTLTKEEPSNWWKYFLAAIGGCMAISLVVVLILVSIKVMASKTDPGYEGIPD